MSLWSQILLISATQPFQIPSTSAGPREKVLLAFLLCDCLAVPCPPTEGTHQTQPTLTSAKRQKIYVQ